VTNITINGISIDPTAPRRTLAALSLDNAELGLHHCSGQAAAG